MFCCSFFFFQAEDGIRDHCVTGVQTCALPILRRDRHGVEGKERVVRGRRLFQHDVEAGAGELPRREGLVERSEERRVGKECRSRWSPYKVSGEEGNRANMVSGSEEMRDVLRNS